MLNHTTPRNRRCRIVFETDVANDYFDRLENRGRFSLRLEVDGARYEVQNYSLNLQNGKATLNVRLPDSCSVGDSLKFSAAVEDNSLPLPFVNVFIVTIGRPQETTQSTTRRQGKPPSNRNGKGREMPLGLQLPEVHEVYEAGWVNRKHKFDQYSALEIIQEEVAEVGDENQVIYSYWVNMDNVYLKTEKKYGRASPEIMDARFKFGLVLVGMSLVQSDMASAGLGNQEEEQDSVNGEELTLDERVYTNASAIAPVLLPMIDSLGNLQEEQVMVGSQSGDDD